MAGLLIFITHIGEEMLKTLLFFLGRVGGLWLAKWCKIHIHIQYLLLTEFEGRTVSYGQSFSLLDVWPKREAYSTDRENEGSKIFIISLVCV